MAIIKMDKIREMADGQLQGKLFEFQKELNTERGALATGGRTSNPGKISQLKKSIARILTVAKERKSGIVRKSKKAASPAKPAAAQQAKPAPSVAAAPGKKQ